MKQEDNSDYIQRMKRSKKGKRAYDLAINKDYKYWRPVSDISRSFFVYKGRYSKSFKEIEISAILKEENLRFYREVSFDLKTRFDFYIPLIDLVIEYDGSQHFTDIVRLKKDIEKEGLLKRLGVKLIRYNKSHDLPLQIRHDLINHPVLKHTK